MPKWEPAPDRGLWALSDPWLSNPSQDGRGGTWVNIAVRPWLHSFLIHNKHHLFENKVWEIYIYIKKCICSLLKSSLSVDYVPVYIYVYALYTIQHKYKSTISIFVLFFNGKDGFGWATKEITNIRLQVSEFELQIIIFYVQSVSLFALGNNAHGKMQIPP